MRNKLGIIELVSPQIVLIDTFGSNSALDITSQLSDIIDEVDYAFTSSKLVLLTMNYIEDSNGNVGLVSCIAKPIYQQDVGYFIAGELIGIDAGQCFPFYIQYVSKEEIYLSV